MDVIPGILSEQTADELTVEQLSMLSLCSSKVVMVKVKAYLANTKANKDIKLKIMCAYNERISMEQFLESEELLKQVMLVVNLNYEDINYNVDVLQLSAYKEAIEDILGNAYSVPYITPTKAIIVKELREEIETISKQTGSPVLKAFTSKLKKYADLFRDSINTSYKGTAVKKIMRNKKKYHIILRGIDFILTKHREECKPFSWRYL